MKVLTKKQVLIMHRELIQAHGGREGLRDEGMLDSALNAPFQTFGGTDLSPSIQQKAAQLCHGLVMNHPFIDGNKRVGVHAMLTFLAINGIELRYTQKELSEIILSAAAGKMSRDDIMQWIIKAQAVGVSR